MRILYYFFNSAGNPEEKQITSQWKVGWHTYLSSRRDFIVAHIDTGDSSVNRVNCGLNDEEQLGSKEADTLLSVLRYEALFFH